MTSTPYTLFLLSITAALSGCQPGTACIQVEPGTTVCPKPGSVKLKEMTNTSCGSDVVAITGEGTLEENISLGYIDSGADPVPGCCYPVTETAPTCVYGRPIRVEGAMLLASIVEDPAWSAELNISELPTELRQALVARWTRAALDEHASIAAFSRVSLDLLRLGAPPELIEQAHRAALDEVRHARQGFAIATALAGQPVGPGPFPLGAQLRLSADLAEVAAEAALEACVGEAVASLLAFEAASRCTEPSIRAVLQGIAQDEQQHALLGWRTLAWALKVGGSDVRTAIATVFARVAVEGVAVPVVGDLDDPKLLATVGLLDRASAAHFSAKVLQEVILPAARLLLREEAPPVIHA
jgi:hypothetical protein